MPASHPTDSPPTPPPPPRPQQRSQQPAAASAQSETTTAGDGRATKQNQSRLTPLRRTASIPQHPHPAIPQTRDPTRPPLRCRVDTPAPESPRHRRSTPHAGACALAPRRARETRRRARRLVQIRWRSIREPRLQSARAAPRVLRVGSRGRASLVSSSSRTTAMTQALTLATRQTQAERTHNERVVPPVHPRGHGMCPQKDAGGLPVCLRAATDGVLGPRRLQP